MMVAESPAAVLGEYVSEVQGAVVQAVRSRHDRFSDAHSRAESRYMLAFGTQWRDLLDDTREALVALGFRTYRLPPAGYHLPVVNNCLIYVWRVPEILNPVSRFASSPTRQSSFLAPLLDPVLFETTVAERDTGTGGVHGQADPENVVRSVGDTMPVVLVMVQSSPRQLQSIDWAVAVLDSDGRVSLHGRSTIWAPELNVEEPPMAHESFDSGTPIPPTVEPREQEGIDPDA